MFAGSCSNIGQGPCSLLLHASLRVPHQLRENAQNSSVDGHLGLNIRATHYVPDRAESWGLWSNVASAKAGSIRSADVRYTSTTIMLSSLWLMSSTSRGTMPVFTTTSIRSLSPSVRYEMAQHASDKTSLSVRWSSWIREGSTWRTKKGINPGQQTFQAKDSPAGLQTGVDKGSCFDISWTTST